MPPPPRQPQQPQRPSGRPPVVNRGPTADSLQPKKRRDKGLIYHETLFEIFGEEACRRGVNMEICSVYGGNLATDGGNEKRIFLAFIDPRTRQPLMFEDVQLDKSQRPPRKVVTKKRAWLAINQTIKKAVKQAFGTARIVNWIGWVTVYVTEVENRLARPPEVVTAIRIKNQLPDPYPDPTFDYSIAIQKRLEQMNNPPEEEMPHAGAGEDAAAAAEAVEEELSASERARIEEAERREAGGL